MFVCLFVCFVLLIKNSYDMYLRVEFHYLVSCDNDTEIM